MCVFINVYVLKTETRSEAERCLRTHVRQYLSVYMSNFYYIDQHLIGTQWRTTDLRYVQQITLCYSSKSQGLHRPACVDTRLSAPVQSCKPGHATTSKPVHLSPETLISRRFYSQLTYGCKSRVTWIASSQSFLLFDASSYGNIKDWEEHLNTVLQYRTIRT